MPSRHARVLISQSRGDPFIHKKIGGIFKVGKKIFKGVQAAIKGTKTAKVLTAAGTIAGGAALVAGGQSLVQAGGGFVGPPVGVPGTGMIPAGTRFVFDPLTGQHVPMKKRRRRRGITATELSGFRKVNRLLSSVGMTPRKARKRS